MDVYSKMAHIEGLYSDRAGQNFSLALNTNPMS